jgi:uncharacterized protein YndB with AHSA1/START domain
LDVLSPRSRFDFVEIKTARDAPHASPAERSQRRCKGQSFGLQAVRQRPNDDRRARGAASCLADLAQDAVGVLAEARGATRAIAVPPLAIGRLANSSSLPVLMFGMSSTCISRHIDAPCAAVYRALLDARAVATWRVPTGMTSHVHAFDPREGGSFRISLTHAQAGTGKTTAHTDTYHGVFVKLVPDQQVVEVVEFETTDPALRGEMTITTTLVDTGGGTDVLVAYEGLPRGVPTADNEIGTRMALAKLAALVEAG